MSLACDTARAFFAAIEAGDSAAVEALYAKDALVWHNTDGQVQTVSENLRVLRWMIRATSSRRYRVLQCVPTPSGFLQEHVLELKTGQAQFELPACVVAEVRRGQIARLHEYLDSAQVAAMRQVLGI